MTKTCLNMSKTCLYMSKTSKTCSKLTKTLKNQQCDGRTDRRTDGPTDRRTDRVTYRVACTRLKIYMPNKLSNVLCPCNTFIRTRFSISLSLNRKFLSKDF